jgi:CheY-like chemotaxis protein
MTSSSAAHYNKDAVSYFQWVTESNFLRAQCNCSTPDFMSDIPTNTQPVLLIEDNEDDIFLMRRALKKSGLNWAMQVVTDGQQALDYFAGAGQYGDRGEFPLPSMVFLDLKLPYVGGFEVLASMREQSNLKETTVIILTSSPEARDLKRAAELGAKAYVLKPPTDSLLKKVAQNEWSSVGLPGFGKIAV